MVIDTIILEGIDKTGKDTILQYIYRFRKGRYAVYQRGNISNTVYAKLFNREKLDRTLNKNCLYVLLTADIEDLNIRFAMNNEPAIDKEKHIQEFHDTFYEMTEGFHRLEFNTSEYTAFKIAKQIIEYCDNINGIV